MLLAALPAFALLAYALGCFLRFRHGLVEHPARHGAVSDASDMLSSATRLITGAQTKWDTIWPPGEMAFTALSGRLDASLEGAGLVQVVCSCAVPWFVADVCRELAGKRAFWFGLATASLHGGLIHYVGFFLSESLFQFTVAVAIWLTTRCVTKTARAAPGGAGALFDSACAGSAWALATLFRPNALPVLLIVTLVLVTLALRARSTHLLLSPLGLIGGAALWLLPAAHRCTLLKGSFCPVSSNFAMNLALGQTPGVAGLQFSPPSSAENTTWFPPSLRQAGHTGTELVPASIFDSRAILQWLSHKLAAEPLAPLRALPTKIRGGFDGDVWPPVDSAWLSEFNDYFTYAFLICVILPALWGIARRLPRACKDPESHLPFLVALSGVLAVVVTGALTLAETRYRFPFDIWWIALCAAAFSKASPVSRASSAPLSQTAAGNTSRKRQGTLFYALAGCAAIASLTLSAAFHPSVALAGQLNADSAPFVGARVFKRANELSAPLRAGSPWDKNTVLLTCDPHCTEVLVHWPSSQRTSLLEVSTDHNDAYRVTFYQEGEAQVSVDLAHQKSGAGLRWHRVVVPHTLSSFDAVGVRPLYGDGRYSLGHVRLHQTPRTAPSQRHASVSLPSLREDLAQQ